MLKINLKKSFKNEQMTFQFELNSNRIVLFGPSGCGKTTLLKMLAGFIKPDAGEIFIDDKCFFSSKRKINVPVFKRHFGYLPQGNTLFPNMTVKENIMYGLKAGKLPVDLPEYENIINRLRITDKLNSMPSTLSGGQIQRAALARVLLIKPKLLLLDEPFSALDTPVKECLRELVSELADELDISIVFVTHDVEDAFIIGREIVVVDNGRVIEFGNMTKIYNSPCYLETAILLDYKNIFSVRQHKHMAHIVNSNNFFRQTHENGFICIRPDKIELKRTEELIDSNNIIKGLVAEVHFRGKYVKILFRTEFDLLFHVHLSQYEYERTGIKMGDRAGIILDSCSINFCKPGLQ